MYRYKSLAYFLAVFIIGMALALVEPAPAGAYELYYLTVGNSKYRDEQLDLPDANLSARQITQYLRQAGAVDGITLVSEQGAYVTRDDVLGALREIASKAKAGEDPLVVYYFIGHGASGEDTSHVSFVGDYPLPDPAAGATRAIIETREIQQLLEEQDLPYILILDNCYYREPEDGIQSLGRGVQALALHAGERIKAVGSTKSMIVLYAAEPGDYVQTLPHPWNDRYAIGPLGRRLLLLFKATSESGKGLSLGRFFEQMNDVAFDPPSTVGYHTEWIVDSSAALIPTEVRVKFVESASQIRRGSGKNQSTVPVPRIEPDRGRGDNPPAKKAIPLVSPLFLF